MPAKTISFVLLSALACASLAAQTPAHSGTTSFILDGNRVYAELHFIRPDGSIHRALAFVDMGSPEMTLTESLFKELQLNQGKPLIFRVGHFNVKVPAKEVASEQSDPQPMGDLKVEGILAAGVLSKYQIAIDYSKRTLAFAKPGTWKPEGIAVPFRINPKTGLIAVDMAIDGKPYPITIDNGSAYTWVRMNTAREWLLLHPDLQRGIGAVGPANMMMSGDTTETSGALLCIPEISIGAIKLRDVGAFAAGPSHGFPNNLDLFDWYSQKNAEPVIGWLGGNVLKAFRLTADYSNGKIYFLKQGEPDPGELDDVGLTLRSLHHEFFVAAVATKGYKPTVEGVRPGDKLLRIGDLDLKQATWGAIYDALRGKPGETRVLTLERNGKQFTVSAPVTAF